jgi:hypothetical protein
MDEHKKLNRNSNPTNPRPATSIRYEISFHDLSLTVGEKKILQGVSGRFRPGIHSIQLTLIRRVDFMLCFMSFCILFVCLLFVSIFSSLVLLYSM